MSFSLGFVQGYIKVLGLNLYTFKKPRNRIKGIDFASLCCLAGGYDNHICHTGPPGYKDEGSLDVYKVTDCHAEVKIEYFIIHQRKFFS
jgi:hypothetical protein